MEKVNKLTEPARKTFGHLQKMVRDIKKNEGGFMDKFKKFQNEHVALICKTGKETWDRITNKAPPNVPRRDYQSENPREEDDDWSDDDFDSDYENPDGQSDTETYVVPSEDYCDGNYEPPPTEAEKKTFSQPFSYPKGEYADKQGNSRQQPFSKPLPGLPSNPLAKPGLPLPKLPNQPSPKHNPTLSKPSPPLPSPRNFTSSKPQTSPRKPHLPPKTNEDNVDEEDYIVPVDEEDEEDVEDNYIDPTEDSPPPATKRPTVNRSVKPTLPGSTSAPVDSAKPVLYEVLDQEAKPSLPPSRGAKPLLPKLSLGGGGPPPLRNANEEQSKSDTSRNNLWTIPSQQKMESTELPTEDEYEICDPDEPDSNGTHVFKPSPTPSPVPRIGKKMPHIPKLKPVFPPREHIQSKEEKPTAVDRRNGSGPDLPFLPPMPAVILKPTIPKSTTLPKPPEPASRNFNTPVQNNVSAGYTSAEQESGVYSKEWYASSCDRKAAEEALLKSNKDGSFLVRKSSGQDLKQPYTLVVFYNKRVYNIPVRYIEPTRQYALGREKSGEERFNSVAEMIQNHQRTPLVLIDSQNNTKDSTKLKHAVRVS